MQANKPLFGRFMLFLFVAQALFIGGVVAMQATNPMTAGILLAVGSPIFIVLLLHLAFRWLWNRMVSPFPPREVPRSATRRCFQSFSWGLVNMGLSIHAATDDTYLHLEPLLLWQTPGY